VSGYRAAPVAKDGMCRQRVPIPGMWSRDKTCSRKAVRDGWCKTHHPDAKAARDKAASERWEQNWKNRPRHTDADIDHARLTALDSAAAACEAMTCNPDNSHEATEAFRDAADAIRKLKEQS